MSKNGKVQIPQETQKFPMNPVQSKMINLISIILFILPAGLNKVQASAYRIPQRVLYLIPFPDRMEFFRTIKSLKIQNIPETKLEILANSFHNPTKLMFTEIPMFKEQGLEKFFKSSLYKSFFFSRFIPGKHSETLLMGLLFKTEKGRWIVDPNYRRNWRNFIHAVKEANHAGYTRIKQNDMEAILVDFLHRDRTPIPTHTHIYTEMADQRTWSPPPEFFPEPTIRNMNMDFFMFFDNEINYVNSYMSPYFTLKIKDPYLQVILYKILSDSSNMDNTRIILNVWRDIRNYRIQGENILKRYRQGNYNNVMTIEHYLEQYFYTNFYHEILFYFKKLILENIWEKESPFADALWDASRENNELNNILTNTINTNSRNRANNNRRAHTSIYPFGPNYE